MVDEKISVSAIVLAYNEEDNIEYCLRSLQWCDEIILIDSGSSDSTVEIAKDFGAEILVAENENGKFDHLRNLGVQESSNEWIFVLDADEVCPSSLSEELVNKAAESDYEAFKIPRRNYFLDEKDQLAHWPDRQLRFHKASVVDYNEELHDFIDFSGERLLEIDSEEIRPIFHFTTQSVSDMMKYQDRYTTTIAKEESKDYSFLSALLKSTWNLFYSTGRNFIYKRGYRRPHRTFMSVFMDATWPFFLEFKKWQINEKGTDEEVLEKINSIREREINKYEGDSQ